MLHDDSYTEFDTRGKWIVGVLMAIIVILAIYVN